MLYRINQCEWVMKNKIPTSFLKELRLVRKKYTGSNYVFSVSQWDVFSFMKDVHETYEKYYELTPKEIPSEKQEENKEEG